MEIQGSVNYQEVIGTVNDPRRVTAEVIAAVRGEKGDQGDPAPGYVEMNDTNTEIMGNYKIQFDQNEFYSDCYLNDGTGDVTLILDPDFDHISGVEKTFLIAGTGVELNLGLGFHLLSGVFDTREREINIVHLLYSAVSGVWVTIKNNNVAEEGIVYGDVTFTPTDRILSEEVRAAIEEVDAKFIDQEFETVPLITNEIDLGSATSDKIEVTISDTDTLESLGTSTEGVRKVVRILLTGDSSDTLTVTHDIRAILLPEQGELVFRHGNNRELWFEAICRGERLWHFVKINSSYSMFTAPDDIADLEDAVNLATANAGEIPFVQEVEGVKSFNYSSLFKYVDGVLQMGDANSNLGIGNNVFDDLTTGGNNFAFGIGCLQHVTTGEVNYAIGYTCLANLTTGIHNIAFGQSALGSNNGNYNCAIGNGVLEINTSSYNTGIGNRSLENSNGIGSTALGYLSGAYIADGTTANENNTNCLYIGRGSRAKADSQTNEIVIGYDAIGNGSNSVTLGNDSITQTILKGNIGIGYTGFANAISYPLQIKTTTAHESAALGNELLSSSNWITTGWTGDFATGFTNTAGNTTALSNTLAAVTNNLYQITYTVTGRTAGTFTIAFGGQSNAGLSATGAWGAKASSTAALTITPTSDFNGTIVISIKQITAVSTPTQVFVDSAGNVSMEVRNTLSTLYNIFIGVGAGRYNTTGNYNTFAGYAAGRSNTTGANNTFAGYAAGYSNTTGAYNTFAGYAAGYSNTTGAYNTFAGMYAGYSNTTGGGNTFAGYAAGYSNTTGAYNTFAGMYAGYSNTTGAYNTFAGMYAGFSNTTGGGNTFAGYQAGYANTTGANNTFAGYAAGRSNTTGANNTFAGYQAGYANTTGANNTFAGMYAGYANTTGANNTFAGMYAGFSNTTGANNTFAGYQAGRYLADGSTANATPANSVYIGYDTRAKAAGGTNEIVVGYQAIGNGSNTATWGNTSITNHYFTGKFNLTALNTAPSSAADTGTTGEIRIANDAIYVCIATNTWVKAAMATW